MEFDEQPTNQLVNLRTREAKPRSKFLRLEVGERSGRL